MRVVPPLVAGLLALTLAGCGEEDSNDGPPPSGCPAEETWPAEWTTFEAEVLVLVNDLRAAGASCGSEGDFPAAPALVANAKLTCAARNHSSDMAHRDFFDHVNPDGDTTADRARTAGYAYQRVGENIALGQTTPEQVMAGWMDSPGHCRNIMSSAYQELGVGFVSTNEDAEPGVRGRYWTQVFGRPL